MKTVVINSPVKGYRVHDHRNNQFSVLVLCREVPVSLRAVYDHSDS